MRMSRKEAIELMKRHKITPEQAKELMKPIPRPSKYGNKKTIIEGKTFHSSKEARRYQELRSLEKAKEISNLRCQVSFEIHSKITTEYGVVIGHRRYIADFVYMDMRHNREVIEDVKGYSTAEFRKKWKQMQQRYSKDYQFLIT